MIMKKIPGMVSKELGVLHSSLTQLPSNMTIIIDIDIIIFIIIS